MVFRPTNDDALRDGIYACALRHAVEVGSLVDAVEGWRSVDGDSLAVSKEIVATSGIWALQYQPESGSQFNEEIDSYINWVKEAQALANRTLIVWLTILGVMTMGGWLA